MQNFRKDNILEPKTHENAARQRANSLARWRNIVDKSTGERIRPASEIGRDCRVSESISA